MPIVISRASLYCLLNGPAILPLGVCCASSRRAVFLLTLDNVPNLAIDLNSEAEKHKRSEII